MKKLLLTGLILLLTIPCLAAGGDITKTENRPNVTTWKLDTVQFSVFTRMCIVVYAKGYTDGAFIVTGSKQILFRDVTDDPATPVDETLTEFTDLITAINNGSNIKTTIMNAVKIKLGI